VHNITHSTNVGKKISAFGVALVVSPPIPDPTDAIGCALVISGRYMQRKASLVLKDTRNEFNKISGELKKARFL
jgi:hypothetical protein